MGELAPPPSAEVNSAEPPPTRRRSSSLTRKVRYPSKPFVTLDKRAQRLQHSVVTFGKLGALFVTLAGVLGGCERAVVSVGAWEPLSQPTSGQGGASALAGSSGAGGLPGGGAGGGVEAGAGGEPALPSSGFYLEAESGELSGGFTIGTDAAASAGQFLQAPDEAVPDDADSTATARYTFTLAEAGDYLIWGRIYSPDIYTNRFHVQVDGGARYLWRISVGNIWYWDDFHDNLQYNEPLRFQLTAGTHELVLGNVAAGARLDRLYITASGDTPPGNNTKCRPPHSIDLDGVCHDSCGARATAEQGTTCVCASRPEAERFEAYDCGGGSCCFTPP